MADEFDDLLAQLASAAERASRPRGAAAARTRGRERTMRRRASVAALAVGLIAGSAGVTYAVRQGPSGPAPVTTQTVTPRPSGTASPTSPSPAPSGGAVSGSPSKEGTASHPASGSAPATGDSSTAPAAPVSGSAPPSNLVTVTITGLPAHPTLTPGGTALTFWVTASNDTKHDYQGVQLLVYADHCGCGPSGAGMFPQGEIQRWNPATKSWQSMPFDSAGTGMDYAYVNEMPGRTLPAHGTLVERYRLWLPAGTSVHRTGDGEISADVQLLPSHADINKQTASHTVHVVT